MDAVSEKFQKNVQKANRNKVGCATNLARKDGKELVQFVGRAGRAKVVVLELFLINAVLAEKTKQVSATKTATRVSTE